MFEKLRRSRDVRLALAIAAGVFGGLLAYRVTASAYAWWNDLPTTTQQDALAFAAAAAFAGAAFYAVRRFLKRPKAQPPGAGERRRPAQARSVEPHGGRTPRLDRETRQALAIGTLVILVASLIAGIAMAGH